MLEATAAIGLLLLTVATLTTCASTTMATSIRRSATVARPVSRSVVSENNQTSRARSEISNGASAPHHLLRPPKPPFLWMDQSKVAVCP